MDFITDKLSSGSERVENSIVYLNELPVGVLLPSMFIGKSSSSGQSFISGPKGISIISKGETKKDIIKALIKSGSILFGEGQDIISAHTLYKNARTSRTASYFSCVSKNCRELIKAFNKLNDSKVLIIGCGGIGSISAMQLAGAGISNIVVIDPDRIEESNFNRQILWDRKDIGRYKVDVIREKICSRFKDVECTAISKSVQSLSLEELASDSHAIVLSADEPIGVAKKDLCALQKKHRFLLVSSGYSHQRATIEIISKQQDLDDYDTNGLRHVEWERSDGFIGPSFGPTNTEISGQVASIIIHSIAFEESYLRLQGDHHIHSWVPKICPAH